MLTLQKYFMKNFTAFGSFKPRKNQGGRGDGQEMNLEKFDTVPKVKILREKLPGFPKKSFRTQT